MNLELVLEIIRKRWKQSLIMVLLATLVTGGILFLQKPIFRSSAIFTAANPNLGDRANIYRTEFWEQYFYYGSEYDNDRLMALAKSEDMFRFLADSFQLQQHYKIIDTGVRGAYLTDIEFKENVRIHKDEYGNVKINVWDEDKMLATRIANAFVKRINQKAVAQSNGMKQEILFKLQQDYQTQKDSLAQLELQMAGSNDAFLIARKSAIINGLTQKESLIQQFQTSLNNVMALFVIEEAVPAFRKEKPLILNGMLTAAVVSFVFSILFLLLLEWKQRYRNEA